VSRFFLRSCDNLPLVTCPFPPLVLVCLSYSSDASIPPTPFGKCSLSFPAKSSQDTETELLLGMKTTSFPPKLSSFKQFAARNGCIQAFAADYPFDSTPSLCRQAPPSPALPILRTLAKTHPPSDASSKRLFSISASNPFLSFFPFFLQLSNQTVPGASSPP